jgi:Mn2+/Fe2+ NRAMP family transporter
MIGIQSVCARIGRVTGEGVGANIRARYGSLMAYALVLALVIANVINLGADIGAMGAALKLLIGGPALAYASAFAVLSAVLQVYVPFSHYSPILKLLTLSLFAYVATVFVIHVPWSEVWRSILLPSVTFDGKYAVAIVAVFGTTISPYLFFWQASQEVEEVNDPSNARKPLLQYPRQGKDALLRIRIDTVSGMVISELVAFFIIVAAAVVLHTHGNTDINSAAQAAAALKPLAGRFASTLFAAGIVGTGLLAVPVLAGSAAFGTAEAFGEPCSLARKPGEAKFFYGTLIMASAVGLALNFSAINPVKALYWSAVINGVAAAPIMIVIMLLASSSRVMGQFALPWGLKILGWAATAAMAVVAVMMFATWGR